MASTDRQPSPEPSPGAILQLKDGVICTLVRYGRRAPPLTLFVRQGRSAEREIPLTDVAEVMWSL